MFLVDAEHNGFGHPVAEGVQELGYPLGYFLGALFQHQRAVVIGEVVFPIHYFVAVAVGLSCLGPPAQVPV
ncbi:hypothetical protein N008_09780 [Hymenobacter sp. APR13]|nr:hypothetical protein N008_09780 [Hymenobacter sp. APR13]